MAIEIKVPQLPESVADATLRHLAQAGRSDRHARRKSRRPRDRQGRARSPGAGERRTEGAAHRRRHVGDERPGSARCSKKECCRHRRRPPRPRIGRRTGRRSRSRDRPLPPAANDSDKLAPSVRRMVEEQKLDPSKIPATGQDGRITKGDVVDYLDQAQGRRRRPAAAPRKPLPRPRRRRGAAGRQDQRVPMTPLRARIAERLLEAQHDAGAAHHVQRGRPQGRHGPAREVQGHASRRSTA